MDIIKKDSFRSKNKPVNKADDMYRIIVDMSRHEFELFTKYKSQQETKEEIKEENLNHTKLNKILPGYIKDPL